MPGYRHPVGRTSSCKPEKRMQNLKVTFTHFPLVAVWVLMYPSACSRIRLSYFFIWKHESFYNYFGDAGAKITKIFRESRHLLFLSKYV